MDQGRQGRDEGKGAIKWTRLSRRSFSANAVRFQLHALGRRDFFREHEGRDGRNQVRKAWLRLEATCGI